jgi:hypothetical protein
MKEVIYIMSVGHSGSTLLDLSLGQYDNAFSTGELKHLSWQLYREDHKYENAEGKCMCNNYFRECYYWSQIITAIESQIGTKIYKSNFKYFEKLAFGQDKLVLKINRKLYKRYTVYSNAFDILFPLKQITRNNLLLYDTIFNVTKVNYIIDSSKDIIRYNKIKKEFPVFPIILIRNVSDLINSKHVNSDFNKLKAGWLNYYNKYVFNIIKELSDKDFHIISYERFIDNPNKEINKIWRKLGVNNKTFSSKLVKDKYHVVGGNPMRYNSNIDIKEKTLDFELYKKSILGSGLSDFYLKRILS